MQEDVWMDRQRMECGNLASSAALAGSAASGNGVAVGELLEELRRRIDQIAGEIAHRIDQEARPDSDARREPSRILAADARP